MASFSYYSTPLTLLFISLLFLHIILPVNSAIDVSDDIKTRCRSACSKIIRYQDVSEIQKFNEFVMTTCKGDYQMGPAVGHACRQGFQDVASEACSQGCFNKQSGVQVRNMPIIGEFYKKCDDKKRTGGTLNEVNACKRGVSGGTDRYSVVGKEIRMDVDANQGAQGGQGQANVDQAVRNVKKAEENLAKPEDTLTRPGAGGAPEVVTRSPTEGAERYPTPEELTRTPATPEVESGSPTAQPGVVGEAVAGSERLLEEEEEMDAEIDVDEVAAKKVGKKKKVSRSTLGTLGEKLKSKLYSEKKEEVAADDNVSPEL